MTSWDDVAATALLGTARRTLPVGDLPEPVSAAVPGGAGADASADLLDVAALATVYRRAGARLLPRRGLPEAAEPDDRPAVPSDARTRLSELLTRNDPELLLEWLLAVVEHRLVVPPRALPTLLETAARRHLQHPGLGPAVAAAGGPRATWLAGFRSRWREALGLPDSTPLPPSAWEFGTPGERRRWLLALRGRDPDAAREVLAAGWAKEPTDARIDLISVLWQGLSLDDEEFLELSLADRRAEVRTVAAPMLAALPGSAHLRRASERARAVVRVEPEGITVHAPRPGDIAFVREAMLPAPLSTWPPDLLDLPVEAEWAGIIWVCLVGAATREGDHDWIAAALRHEPSYRDGRRPANVERASTAMVAAAPVPWPATLRVAVLDWLDAERGSLGFRPVLDLAAHRLPPDAADDLYAVGRQWPADSPTRYAFIRAVELMALRRAMIEELQ